ncbi:magnesium/cobalt transporter CorA [Salinibacter ruber]|uniref:magnesium/cobalt transporter CorA n=1 Tax=Salinibacter ruber TaxID=146919 RepID=UPI0021681D85|nr:magnesium/cobalt transporter CorA [Salinibacter ruber]MCS3702495.1 magnesium transporter [Salinibacter ruber]
MSSPESDLIPINPEQKVGLPPGSVVFVGEERTEPVEFRVLEYGPDHLVETDNEGLDEVLKYRDTTPVTWINVTGVHDESVIRTIGDHFHVHPLIQEDIVHTGQRPKLDPQENYLYLVVKMLYFDEDRGDELRAEQVSFLVGERNLISFQEDPGDVFDPVRKRIRNGRGRIRDQGPDYLAYALLDVIVDHYFVVLEELGARTEDLEDEIMGEDARDVEDKIHDLRRDLIFMRRMTWPMRELLHQLERLDSSLWADNNQPYVRDTYDHVVQVLDLVEALRDTASGLHDLHMTSISNRMNEIMKVLTIIGTIFIPLTFVAGIYGMNFEYMPELAWKWAYPTVWGLMIALAGALLLYFRRREWI